LLMALGQAILEYVEDPVKTSQVLSEPPPMMIGVYAAVVANVQGASASV
jgi:hypothetical protein